MIKRLTRHGNSLALVIEKGVLDLLDIDAQTRLAVSTDGTRLTITPVRRRAGPGGGAGARTPGAERDVRVGAGAGAGGGAPQTGLPASWPDRSAEVYAAALRGMSLEQKLRVSEELRETAWELKAGFLARRHPEWSREELARGVAEAFARGGA